MTVRAVPTAPHRPLTHKPCRTVSTTPGLLPPSCPGVPDQPRRAGRDEKGGAGWHSRLGGAAAPGHNKAVMEQDPGSSHPWT